MPDAPDPALETTGVRYQLTRTSAGWMLSSGEEHRHITDGLDSILVHEAPLDHVGALFDGGRPTTEPTDPLPPIGTQEVWAAGVTYRRSRDARKVESERSGGEVFYDLVYEAERPELFFKATPHRVVGHRQAVNIRRDSTWDVPEPEFTLVVSAGGDVVGATVGNDMSSRSIEGENPLYLPQAKVYSACAALGPCIVLTDEVPASNTAISMQIERDGDTVFEGATALDRIKRTFDELVEHLFRDNDFPTGVFLMTGTGIVPGDGFTLRSGDLVRITIDGIGTLENSVA